jgi:hypothetical protein
MVIIPVLDTYPNVNVRLCVNQAMAPTLLELPDCPFESAERRMGRMTTRLVTLSYRLALFVCGVISLLLGRAFRMIQGVMPDANVNWSLFSITLTLVGGLIVVIALLPISWVKRVYNSVSGRESDSSMPIKLLGGFALFSYLLTVGLNFAPRSWHLTPQLVYLACPACVLTVTVDPSLGAVISMLAPLNAAVYGSLGALLGYFFLAVRNRI